MQIKHTCIYSPCHLTLTKLLHTCNTHHCVCACTVCVCVCVCVSSLTVTLEYYISIRLSFRSFRPVTEEADCFKISLWHVRCVQYIISAVTSWIAHFMLWMCQYYEVLSSDLMGSVSVDKLWPMPAHTHTRARTHRDSVCVTLPIPGHCLNKMLYPCAICSMLYLWQEMYLITFFLAIRPRLTRALRLRWQERFASYLQRAVAVFLFCQIKARKRKCAAALASLSFFFCL